MQRITLAGRLIITLIVVAAVYFGFRYFAGNRPAPAVATATSTAPGTAEADTGEEADSTTVPAPMGRAGAAFTYEAPAPVNGKLKGVVELGASGFNSF
ncbi:MAG: hypothetical protein EOO57_14835, partial [Hymenobacter sp.]